ncbi:MAG: phosphoribosyltransferase-like protein [Candidatus Nanopelagicales bacterium]
MDRELGLNILSDIMRWDDERAQREFQWLRLMARLKYDGYRDFLAGVRFFETLAHWLQQFEPEERETAYQFVRRKLVYIGSAEINHLADRFYHQEVEDHLLRAASQQCGVPPYRVWTNTAATEEFERQKRKMLFMALSDGARMDVIRHANVRNLSNEQFVGVTQADDEKWEDLLKELRKDLKDDSARFSSIYLIDDFTGSGNSLLRPVDKKEGDWKGKLMRFRTSIQKLTENKIADNRYLEGGWRLRVHHYIGGYDAKVKIAEREAAARRRYEGEGWFNAVKFSFGMELRKDFPIQSEGNGNEDFIALTDKYYNPSIEDRHTDVGGVKIISLGFGACGFPLVLEHNTPNNSVALLWAEADSGEKDGVKYRAMRPLFRRRPRHF